MRSAKSLNHETSARVSGATDRDFGSHVAHGSRAFGATWHMDHVLEEPGAHLRVLEHRVVCVAPVQVDAQGPRLAAAVRRLHVDRLAVQPVPARFRYVSAPQRTALEEVEALPSQCRVQESTEIPGPGVER